MSFLEEICNDDQKISAKEKFKKQIISYSRYLSFADVDYKYNSTFLSEYLDDYLDFKRYAKLKMKIYIKIKDNIINMNIPDSYTLTLDNAYQVVQDKVKKNEVIFLNPEFKKIRSDRIHVYFIKNTSSNDELFYKEYRIKEYKSIIKDINRFVRRGEH